MLWDPHSKPLSLNDSATAPFHWDLLSAVNPKSPRHIWWFTLLLCTSPSDLMSATTSVVLPILPPDRWKGNGVEERHCRSEYSFEQLFNSDFVFVRLRWPHRYHRGYCVGYEPLLPFKCASLLPGNSSAYCQRNVASCSFVWVWQSMKWHKGPQDFLIPNTFYYNVKYKTITKELLCTYVQSSRLYYIFWL